MADELYMNGRGVSKIFEALCATVILLFAVQVFSQLLMPVNPFPIQAEAELKKLGYNVLQQMAINGGIEEALFNSTTGELRRDWESRIKISLQNILPKGVFFNVSIYNATYVNVSGYSSLILQPLNETKKFISNFEEKLEGSTSVGITYIYTAKRIAGKIWILVIRLNLIRGEGYG